MKMQKKIYQKIIKVLGEDRVKINEPMAKHTTFKIGGPADLFYEAKTESEIIKAVLLSRKYEVPYFILGGGSNLLVSDRGFRGLIIKINNDNLKVTPLKDGAYRINTGAGIKLSALVSAALTYSLTGLEFLVGIPGLLGGAVRGNAGAWGMGIGDVLEKIKIFDKTGRVGWISKNDCRFGYRQSRFKKSGDVILEAAFVLEKRPKAEIKKKITEFMAKRINQPKQSSAGCVFINPKPQAAGELIDRCELKDVISGDAQISGVHANFIVNLDKAKAADVIKLIALAKKKVKEKFGIALQEEICLVGFDNIIKQPKGEK